MESEREVWGTRFCTQPHISFLFFSNFIISLFMNRTLTSNTCIIRILVQTVRHGPRHIRDRRLQGVVAGLVGGRRHPPCTNIQL